MFVNVPRATRIRVRAFNPHGASLDFEAEDFLARIIQHERDHLDGIIFLDRLDIVTRQAKLQEWQEVREKLMATAKGA
jgi:peptide deformylase